jgi:hypothetical protein
VDADYFKMGRAKMKNETDEAKFTFTCGIVLYGIEARKYCRLFFLIFEFVVWMRPL